ncbi:MAG: phage tail protein [Kofleriaceae bacterium]|nr:phage tail protein [Kofleriaceae bacterium]
MAKFPANPHRQVPYNTSRFRVKMDGRYVAGLSKCSALKRTVEVVKHREGNDPLTAHHMPGAVSFEAITLERGVTHDEDFEKWANLVYDVGAAGAMSLKQFRKDIIIEFLNEAGQIAKVYKVYRCWVSEFQALPELDANANAVAIEHIKLENEGWERDTSVPEPIEA